MSNRQLALLKTRRALRLWFAASVEGTVAPVFNKGELFQLINLIFVVFIAYWVIGEPPADKELAIWWASRQTFFTSLPVWAALNAILAIFGVRKREREKGKWYGTKFVYNAPEPVTTLLIEPKDNERRIPFTVKDAEPNTFVQFKLHYDGGLTKVQIGQGMNWDWISRKTTYGHRISRKRAVSLTAQIPAKSNPTIVRVEMLSWEV